MKQIEILVVGGGPAGLCAALAASSLGAKVLICERDDHPGGQLVKQTHKFFGSEKQFRVLEYLFILFYKLLRQIVSGINSYLYLHNFLQNTRATRMGRVIQPR